MDLSLRPQQRPEQRMHTVTIEEIVSLGTRWNDRRPGLENYFSPSRREQFEKEYIHYLNTLLLEMKHGNLDLDLYLLFVVTFQFIVPLLGITAERELGQFYKILEQKYDVEDLDINLHFSTDQYVAPPDEVDPSIAEDPGSDSTDDYIGREDEYSGREVSEVAYTGAVRHQEGGAADPGGKAVDEGDEHADEAGGAAYEEDGSDSFEGDTSDDRDTSADEKDGGSGRMIGEEEALSAFREELDATWEGRRQVKGSVQKRLKQDGIRAIMKWQQEKDFPELAEAFGRSVVIPSFFSFRDKKLLGFYRSTTEGITYEAAVPEML